MNAHRSRPWLVATSIALAVIGGCSQTHGSDGPAPPAAADADDGQDTGGEAASAAPNDDAEASAGALDEGVPPTEPPGESPGGDSPGQEALDPETSAIGWRSLVEAEEWAQLRSELPCIFESPTATPGELELAQELDERARDELRIDVEDPDLVAPTDPLQIAPDDAGEP